MLTHTFGLGLIIAYFFWQLTIPTRKYPQNNPTLLYSTAHRDSSHQSGLLLLDCAVLWFCLALLSLVASLLYCSLCSLSLWCSPLPPPPAVSLPSLPTPSLSLSPFESFTFKPLSRYRRPLSFLLLLLYSTTILSSPKEYRSNGLETDRDHLDG